MSAVRVSIAVACAAVSLSALASPSKEISLGEVLSLKSKLYLARQQRAVQVEMDADAPTLPQVVEIRGRAPDLATKLRMPDTTERIYSVGDHIGGGWTVFAIRPNEVIAAPPAAGGRGGETKLVPLKFSMRRAADDGRGSQGYVPDSPPLPDALAAQKGNLR